MIRHLILLVLLALPLPAWAETARVASGEHADFSRLVVTLETPSAWRLGRTGDGYALSLQRAGIGFDVADVFARIPRSRIQALRQDTPASRLQLAIACACHATAFEFRPGIIVLDIRNGPAPAGSAFEQPLPAPKAVGGGPDVSLAAADHLHDRLLRELSLGAARGVVDLALAPDHPGPLPEGGPPGLRITAEPGFAPRQGGGAPPATIDPACVADTALAVETWGGAGDAGQQLATARSLLAGERDRPAPAQAGQAARMLIHLGFGAEARQVIRSLAADLPDSDLLLALAALVDGQPDPSAAFAAMERCDSAAALWAILARQQLRPSEPIAAAAALRAFSALPLHLRRHLALPLSQRFSAQGDAESVRRVRNALAWSVGPDDPAARLLTAVLPGEQGRAAALTALVAADRSNPAALMALVETQFSEGKPVAPDLVADLAALRHSLRPDRATAAGMTRALALAQALSADFAAAFTTAAELPATMTDIWALLATNGPDSALLHHAVLGPDAPRPRLAEKQALRVAERLAGLGFPAEAVRWLRHGAAGDAAGAVVAQAEFAWQDADLPTAAAALASLPETEARDLRARIASRAGRFDAAAGLFLSAGLVPEARQARRLARQWPEVATEDEGAWQAAAQLPLRPLPTGPPLASARALLEDSAAARARLSQLFDATRLAIAVED